MKVRNSLSRTEQWIYLVIQVMIVLMNFIKIKLLQDTKYDVFDRIRFSLYLTKIKVPKADHEVRILPTHKDKESPPGKIEDGEMLDTAFVCK